MIEVIETSKVYVLEKTRTNKGLKLRHGEDEKIFRIEFVSNADFIPTEFEKWKTACESKGIALPTFDDVEKKTKDIAEGVNYQFKEEDIEGVRV